MSQSHHRYRVLEVHKRVAADRIQGMRGLFLTSFERQQQLNQRL